MPSAAPGYECGSPDEPLAGRFESKRAFALEREGRRAAASAFSECVASTASDLGSVSELGRATCGLRKMSAVEHEKQLRATYEAFNARDIDAVLRQLTADVDWPNAWEGGRVHGHEGVRDYWTRQWAVIDPTVKPVGFTTRSDGSIAVEVDQLARGLDGTLLGEGRVFHVYVFRDDLVARMDVEELSSAD
jgi:hypothetical protein